jgi:hypothetical protein
MTEDEQYVKSIYPRADVKEIPPNDKQPGWPKRTRYFIGIWLGSVCVDILGSTEYHPDDAWTTAKIAIMARMLKKLEK